MKITHLIKAPEYGENAYKLVGEQAVYYELKEIKTDNDIEEIRIRNLKFIDKKLDISNYQYDYQEGN